MKRPLADGGLGGSAMLRRPSSRIREFAGSGARAEDDEGDDEDKEYSCDTAAGVGRDIALPSAGAKARRKS